MGKANGSRACAPDDKLRVPTTILKNGGHGASAPLPTLRKLCDLLKRRGPLICPSGGLLTGLSSLISDFPKNILVPTHPKSHLELFASHPTEGRIAIVTDAGCGCGGRGSVLRATGSQGGLAKGL
jgi:hypothetical protein